MVSTHHRHAGNENRLPGFCYYGLCFAGIVYFYLEKVRDKHQNVKINSGVQVK